MFIVVGCTRIECALSTVGATRRRSFHDKRGKSRVKRAGSREDNGQDTTLPFIEDNETDLRIEVPGSRC